MKRLYPLRDYDEHDVINFFARSSINASTEVSGDGDSGVIVAVSSGNLDQDPITFSTNGYQGKTDYAYVGRNQYPEVPHKITSAGTGDVPLGITLREAALEDENGEKILYYRQKGIENQIMISGQAEPVLTRGVVTLSDAAFLSDIPAVNSQLVVASGNGQFDALGAGGAGTTVVGKVLATGSRTAGQTSDYYAGSAGSTGTYAVVQVSF